MQKAYSLSSKNMGKEGDCRRRIYERTISMRFLGIILRFLRPEVSLWILKLKCRNCKRLCEFEEIEDFCLDFVQEFGLGLRVQLSQCMYHTEIFHTAYQCILVHHVGE